MDTKNNRKFTRREILKFGAGMMSAALVGGFLPRALLKPDYVVEASSPSAALSASSVDLPADKIFAATDGWIFLPPNAKGALQPYHPDDYSPFRDPDFPEIDYINTYMFGFRDVTDLFTAFTNPLDRDRALSQMFGQQGLAQHSAPIIQLYEYDPAVDPLVDPLNKPYIFELWNLGLKMRPDLFDSHTIHFHGFRNVIPMFDGEPTSSVAVPLLRNLKYVYKARYPGTYMFHCHFEDTEHVHMGMTGMAIIHPILNRDLVKNPTGKKHVFNITESWFDREFSMFLSEVWAYAHWADSHFQLPEWAEYQPDYWLLNGRTYPDTLLAPGLGTAVPTKIDPNDSARLLPDTGFGELIPPTGSPLLQYQPYSSLVQAKEGERVLLRFSNLGYQVQTMVLDGIKMHVIGRDASPLIADPGNPASTDRSYMTSSISIGPGESFDCIFVAPAYTNATPGQPDKYLLYNRNIGRTNDAGLGRGGQMTEIHIYPSTDPRDLPVNNY